MHNQPGPAAPQPHPIFRPILAAMSGDVMPVERPRAAANDEDDRDDAVFQIARTERELRQAEQALDAALARCNGEVRYANADDVAAKARAYHAALIEQAAECERLASAADRMGSL
ncbi:hypothetical protein [Pseudacidovorax intermedius]|uniref:Uncharacterized protein n=1 Tax=Pseudacidovorax intermedius TaxID=433924 RepID=A0A147GNW4_9BURK|nr:hypothetical protein [Pseudacidovorax intermedius]KTT15835.1 hypothetical protein NS331_19435 [Pseudacidovorax intermedius]